MACPCDRNRGPRPEMRIKRPDGPPPVPAVLLRGRPVSDLPPHPSEICEQLPLRDAPCARGVPRRSLSARAHALAEGAVRRGHPRPEHPFDDRMADTRSWLEVAAARRSVADLGRDATDLRQHKGVCSFELAQLVEPNVVPARHHLAIPATVVLAIPVAMMDDLAGLQGPTEFSRGQYSMEQSRRSIDADLEISAGHATDARTSRGLPL